MAATTDAKPLTVRCQCGSVSFPTPAAKPLTLFYCHCTECQKQTSSAFGTSAIFPAAGLFPLAPDLAGRLTRWTRRTEGEDGGRGRTMDCYFCSACGSRLLHRIVDADGTPRSTVSIKGGCVEGLDWTGGMHIYVRSAVIKIPAEWEQYETVPPWMK
ncbi:Mss4-like protein [Hypoxylon rubiginosum]|uniref:Mss4-like protein n=1 Tax=Hypoxylon rubiginosum TaxID=110542 RepID=A0ACB9YMR5_9PEZI|nr:Mss4-like protein [Hypoxylon rubiginosum]